MVVKVLFFGSGTLDGEDRIEMFDGDSFAEDQSTMLQIFKGDNRVAVVNKNTVKWVKVEADRD